MTKEKILRKAFSQAASSAAISYAEHDIDFMIMKNEMLEYVKKHDKDITEEDIVAYLKYQIAQLNEAIKDFTFQTTIMK